MKKVWNTPNPKPKSQRTKLSPLQQVKARAAARKAGRPYPNLVDNMRASRS